MNKEPLNAKCFRCGGLIIVNFAQRTGQYSQKNSWSYWTNESEIIKKRTRSIEYICDDCLLELYYRHKKEMKSYIPNEKKRNLLKIYINEGMIGTKKPFLIPE